MAIMRRRVEVEPEPSENVFTPEEVPAEEYDADGNPIQYEAEQEYDADGNPIQYEAVQEYDENGNPVTYDEYGEYETAPADNIVDMEAQRQQQIMERLRAATLDELGQAIRAQREKRAELKRQRALAYKAMETIASIIFEKMDAEGLTKYGIEGEDGKYTVYDYDEQSAVVDDREVFLEFIKEALFNGDENALDFMECRAGLKAALDYADTHEGFLPPGVHVNSRRVLGLKKV